ncbi:uncharacterized protein J3D65DRAFT_101276 [Phyllosticta citribraziliensis]|uniref:Uncharacterized protein n=1 Tax=Phyllosticta citribraziliensis TaxID=989973 RepID=A0ABR1LAL5_9PEZI
MSRQTDVGVAHVEGQACMVAKVARVLESVAELASAVTLVPGRTVLRLAAANAPCGVKLPGLQPVRAHTWNIEREGRSHLLTPATLVVAFVVVVVVDVWLVGRLVAATRCHGCRHGDVAVWRVDCGGEEERGRGKFWSQSATSSGASGCRAGQEQERTHFCLMGLPPPADSTQEHHGTKALCYPYRQPWMHSSSTMRHGRGAFDC